MNQGITRLCKKYSNALLTDNYYGLFCDHEGLLSGNMGRFWHGAPNSRDDIHLGSTGIRLLSRCIKHTVLKRKGSVLNFVTTSNNIDVNRFNSRNSVNNSNYYFGTRGAQSSFDGQYSRAVTHPRRFSHDGFTQHGRS